MKTLNIIILSILSFSFNQASAQQIETYASPTLDDKYVDWCFSTDIRKCGKIAADAFCRSEDHISAKNFTKSPETSRDVVYVSDLRRCRNPFGCNFFSRIDCFANEEAEVSSETSVAPPSVVNPKGIQIANSSALIKAIAPTGIKSTTMSQPRINNRRVDFCISPIGKCGFYTAEDLCRERGYDFATNFRQARTMRRDTVYPASGNSCVNPVGCNWIEELSCGEYVGTPSLTTLDKDQRGLLIMVADLSSDYESTHPFATVYNFIERSAEIIAVRKLRQHYKETLILKDNLADIDFMLQSMERLTNDDSIKAVDVVFVTHGSDSRIHFSESSSITSGNLSRLMQESLTAQQRSKLRALFSTACFGASHTTDWLTAGFKVVSGANEVYTDSASSYLPMLETWANGETFNQSIINANKADHRDITDSAADEAAARNLTNSALDGYAGRIDSTRIVKGEGRITISKMKVGQVLH